MSNKERGFYYAEYICLNCKNIYYHKVTFGKELPILSSSEHMLKNYPNEYDLSPECTYCGCKTWSKGKYSGN